MPVIGVKNLQLVPPKTRDIPCQRGYILLRSSLKKQTNPLPCDCWWDPYPSKTSPVFPYFLGHKAHNKWEIKTSNLLEAMDKNIPKHAKSISLGEEGRCFLWYHWNVPDSHTSLFLSLASQSEAFALRFVDRRCYVNANLISHQLSLAF